MKIAIFEPSFFTPRPNASSYLVVLQNQIERLVSLANEVAIVAEDKSASFESKKDCQVYVVRGLLDSLARRFSAHKKVIPYFSDFFSIDIVLKAARILKKKIKPDAIYTCGSSFASIFTALLGKMTGIPTLHYISTPISEQKWWRADADALRGYKIPVSYLIKQISLDALRALSRRRFFIKWGLKNVSSLIASSEYIKKDICNSGLHFDDMPVVYFGADMPEYKKPLLEKEAPIVTYFGHLWQGRGVLDLVEAFSLVVKRHPKVKLMLATTNIHSLTESHLKKIIERNNLNSNIIQKGIVNNIYSEVLSNSDVIVLPYRDTPSIKLVESMAAGKPVITTKLSWAPELISDGINGFLVDVGDVQAITEKINLILESPGLSDKIGINAKETIESKCDLDKNTRVINEIIKETVSIKEEK